MSPDVWRSSLLLNRTTTVVVAALAIMHWLTVDAWPGASEVDPVPMVTIPAGAFLMGTPEGQGREDEWPQRSVYLDAFMIDQVEVTNERYMRFVKATGHRTPPNPYGTTDDLVRRQDLLRVGRETAADGSRMGKGCARDRRAPLSVGQ